MAHFMGTLCILALGLMMNLRDGDAHRLCGFKLAKIIRQVCDVAECDSTNGLLQIDVDDEQAISNKCCAHPSGCTLDYIQKWCCRNQNKYDLATEHEKRTIHRFGTHKKIHYKRPSVHFDRDSSDDDFLSPLI